MKILLVTTQSFITGGDGIATYSRHAVQAHLAAGNEVHLLALNLEGHAVKRFSAPGFSYSIVGREEVRACEGTNPNPNSPVAEAIANAVEHLLSKRSFDVIEGAEFLTPLHLLSARKRAGLLPGCPPIAILNHGLSIDIHKFGGVFPSEWNLRPLWAEVQSLQWADIRLAPSEAAVARVQRLLDKDQRCYLLREPYTGSFVSRACVANTKFLHYGRVSYAKGIDRMALLMNALRTEWPVDNISMIGGEPDTPFRRSNAKEYFLSRLHPQLREKVTFHGRHSADAALILAADSGFHVNCSRSETFSYAQVETISQGVVPLVLSNSPMAEFFPASLSHALITPEALHGSRVKPVLEFWASPAGLDALKEVQARTQEITAPAAFASRYAEILEQHKAEDKKRVSVSMSQPYSNEDISVLFSCHNDASLLSVAVNSLKQQTMPPKRILVFDDGSYSDEHFRILSSIAEKDRVEVMYSSNILLAGGRCRLMDRVETPLLVFMDSDDMLDPLFMETTLKTLNANPDCSAVLTQRKNFGQNEEVISDFLIGSPYHWAINDFRMTSLLKTDVTKKLGFDPEMLNGEADDWHFWLRFTIHGYKAAYCPLPLFRYRVTPGSMSWPWHEGQAALTSSCIQDVMAEAREFGYDMSEAFQALHMISVARQFRASRGTAISPTGFAMAKEAINDRWLALGAMIGQGKPLRETIAGIGSEQDLQNHILNSRWMKIGRKLRMTSVGKSVPGGEENGSK